MRPRRSLTRVLRASFFFSLILAGGCARSAERTKGKYRTYPIRGVVVSVNSRQAEITLKHEEIRGYMPAMTMSYKVVDDPRWLKELAPGDKVSARLKVGETEAHIEDITVSGSIAVPDSAPRVDPAKIAKRGDALPDVRLTDQDGHSVTLSQFRGEPVAISFIYTRCPVAWACPATLSKLARAAAAVSSSGLTRFHILLVTIDPKNDTPEVLKAYAGQVDIASGRWTFATGDLPAIAKLAEPLGLVFYRDLNEITHSIVVAVVGPDGRLAGRLEGRDWKPDDVAALLRGGQPQQAN